MKQFWKVAIAIAALSAVLLSPHESQAGNYILHPVSGPDAPNPSGGTAVNPSVSLPYTGGEHDYGRTTGGGPFATCSGIITTVYDWKRDLIASPNTPGQMIDDPADDPPQEVIVKEYCKALYSSRAAPGGAKGSCSNGLGFDSVDKAGPWILWLPYGPPGFIILGDWVQGISEGVRFKKQTGGQTVTVTCSPSAAASTPNGPCQVTVTYFIDITPLSVDFLGVTHDGSSLKFLTGQGVTASLNAHCEVKQDSYKWELSGLGSPIGNPPTPSTGGVFKDYQYTGSPGRVTYLSPRDKTLPTFSFYTVDKADLSVKCDAELVFPDSTPEFPVKIESPLPKVSVTAKAIESIRPSSFDWPIINGVVRGDADPIKAFGYFGIIGAFYLNGQDWDNVNVTVPYPFVQQGECCFVQLINANRTLERILLPFSNGATVYEKDPFNALPCLDSGFPYPYANVHTNYKWNVRTSVGVGGDRPEQPVSTSVSDNGGTDWRRSTALDSMTTWLMYQPPSVGGQSTTWIPIASYDWGWSGTAQKVGPPPNPQSTEPTWELTAHSKPPNGPVTPQTTTVHPTWGLYRISPSPFGFEPRP